MFALPVKEAARVRRRTPALAFEKFIVLPCLVPRVLGRCSSKGFVPWGMKRFPGFGAGIMCLEVKSGRIAGVG